MFVISLFYQMFPVRVYARSLFIKSDMLIWILLYNYLFKKCIFYIVDVSELSKIDLTRDDYLRESKNDHDMWLKDPDWKLSPTIYFVDGYPCILT